MSMWEHLVKYCKNVAFINICKRALIDVKYHADGRECRSGDGLGPNSCLHLEVSLQESKIMYHKNQRNSLTLSEKEERENRLQRSFSRTI